MKKFIVLSALVAVASTAFVACSSDDDLAQQPKAPETTVEEGTPLVIKVVDATRGTDWTNGAGANPLDKFTLFATSNGGTTRWANALGDRDDENVSNGTVFNNDGSGNFASASSINWQDGTWDFYAISDATFPDEAVPSPGTGVRSAEHLDASPRTFTYTVPTAYADQTDLLVGAAIGKQQSNGDVSIPFYHALARIEKFMVYFKQLKANDKIESNNKRCFLIKSITLKGVKKTGTFTFPTSWSDDPATWATATSTTNPWSLGATTDDYTIELADFERVGSDPNDPIKIFTEYTNPLSTDASQNIPTGMANTDRGGTGVPNYFTPNNTRIELPIAAGDEGLYLLPQELNSTVTPAAGNTYTITGPYVEIEGLIFTNPDAWDAVAEYIGYAEDEITGGDDAAAEAYFAAAADEAFTALKQGEYGSAAVGGGICNNYNFTNNTTMSKFACPISVTLLPNKRYALNIDLSYIMTQPTQGDYVFDAADINL